MNRIFSYLKKINIKIILICIGITVIASLIIFMSSSSSKIETKKQKKQLTISSNEAEKYFYDGDYDAAISEYDKLQAKETDNVMWIIKKAEIYSIKGDLPESNKYIQLAKELREQNAADNVSDLYEDYEARDKEISNYIVFTDYINKNFIEALNYGEKSLAQYKNDKKLIKTMIPVYMSNLQVEKAKELVDNYPVNKESSYDLAEFASLKMLVDRWDEGLEILKQAWYLDKDEYKVFDVLAQVYTNNREVLVQKIAALSGQNPNEYAYKIWLAKVYSMSGETSELAQQQLDIVSESEVGKFEKILIQAAVYQNTSRTYEANGLLSSLIKQNADDYRIYHSAGWFYLQNKDFTNALEACKMSILKNKDYPDNYGFLMTEILKAMGKTHEGEPFFRTALLKEPYNYHVLNTIANYYWYTENNSEKALEYFRLAEIIKPEDSNIKYNIAMINIRNNKFDDAVNLLGQCIKISGNILKYHRTLGTIYMQQQKYELGISEFRAAFQISGEDLLTLNNIGCYYIMVEGNLEKGMESLEKANSKITETTEEYNKQTIIDNLKKAQEVTNKYKNSSGNELISIPELVLFY